MDQEIIKANTRLVEQQLSSNEKIESESKHEIKTEKCVPIKKFSCEICEKSFILPSKLKKHEKIHGERKFQCENCEKRYTTKGNLETHKRTHTRQLGRF